MVALEAPAPQKHGLDFFQSLPASLMRVDHAGQGDAGGALGVVVPHRDAAVLQLVEDLEAVGLGDVLEVHRAEGGRGHAHEVDDLLGDVLVRVLLVEREARQVRPGSSWELMHRAMASTPPR